MRKAEITFGGLFSKVYPCLESLFPGFPGYMGTIHLKKKEKWVPWKYIPGDTQGDLCSQIWTLCVFVKSCGFDPNRPVAVRKTLLW